MLLCARILNLKPIGGTHIRAVFFVTHSQKTKTVSGLGDVCFVKSPEDRCETTNRGHLTLLNWRNTKFIEESFYNEFYADGIKKSNKRKKKPASGFYLSNKTESLPLSELKSNYSLSVYVEPFNNSLIDISNFSQYSSNVFIPKDYKCIFPSQLSSAEQMVSPTKNNFVQSLPSSKTSYLMMAFPFSNTPKQTMALNKGSCLCPLKPAIDNAVVNSSVDLFTRSPSNANKTPPKKQNTGGPSEEQLILMKEKLITIVPQFFKKPHDYRIYHPDVVFVNNFWGRKITRKGIRAYMLELVKVRMLSHMKYAHLQMSILNISIKPETASIRLHWRVSGLPQLKTLQIWNFMPWTYRSSLKSESQFFEGISTLFLNSDGFIYKHVVDRIISDEELLSEKNPDLALKLGLLFGLLPRTGFLQCGISVLRK
ncbi:uncharacterized protein LOC106871490 [Octopus bimaculoides]|nr:uncharacterized protein LOC106871490 [Octopus bimaculoides]